MKCFYLTLPYIYNPFKEVYLKHFVLKYHSQCQEVIV